MKNLPAMPLAFDAVAEIRSGDWHCLLSIKGGITLDSRKEPELVVNTNTAAPRQAEDVFWNSV
jgi:hypothetical protein